MRRPVESGQYTALTFGQRCGQAGIDVSMSRRGCALDNAVAKTSIASLKKELIRRRSWPTRRDAPNAIFSWIEGWYNRRRLHSAHNYQSPADFENRSLGADGPDLAASQLARSQKMINQKAA